MPNPTAIADHLCALITEMTKRRRTRGPALDLRIRP